MPQSSHRLLGKRCRMGSVEEINRFLCLLLAGLHFCLDAVLFLEKAREGQQE